MKTTHNGIEIDWEFVAIVDTHDNNWVEWVVTGKALKCKTWCDACKVFDWGYCEQKYYKFQGTCQADAKDPQHNNTGEVLNIEEI